MDNLHCGNPQREKPTEEEDTLTVFERLWSAIETLKEATYLQHIIVDKRADGRWTRLPYRQLTNPTLHRQPKPFPHHMFRIPKGQTNHIKQQTYNSIICIISYKIKFHSVPQKQSKLSIYTCIFPCHFITYLLSLVDF